MQLGRRLLVARRRVEVAALQDLAQQPLVVRVAERALGGAGDLTTGTATYKYAGA
jgi:hypothetical protein